MTSEILDSLKRTLRAWNHLVNGTAPTLLLSLAAQKILEYTWARRQRTGKIYRYSLPEGGKLLLNPNNALSKFIHLGGFEKAERRFLIQFLTEGDVFIDVGANIGLFTVLASRLVGMTGKVVSFEPTPTTYERLVDNVELNHLSNVMTFPYALSNMDGEMILFEAQEGFDAWNSLAAPSIGGEVRKTLIRCKRWDSFDIAGLVKHPVTLMKIDVEGWEAKVLEGARTSLIQDSAPVLMVEFADTNCQAAGTTALALYELICRYGYDLYTYDPATNELHPEPLRDNYSTVNLIAVKDVQSVRERLGRQS